MPTAASKDANGKERADSSEAKGGSKRRKVGQACIYCRRSHMTCDESRPCRRCIKRDIGHLCHDEAPSRPSQSAARSTSPASTGDAKANASTLKEESLGPSERPQSMPFDSSSAGAPQSALGTSGQPLTGAVPSSQLPPMQYTAQHPQLNLGPDMFAQDGMPGGVPMLNNWGAASMLGGAGFLGLGGGGPSGIGTGADFLASGDAAGGNEFNILSEFLESLDGTSALPTPQPALAEHLMAQAGQPYQAPVQSDANTSAAANAQFGSAATPSSSAAMQNLASSTSNSRSAHSRNRSQGASLQEAAALAANSKTETFFLTAADQKDGSRDERLGRVIQAKLDAGLLRPYNHVKGYARLNHWMEQNCTQASKRRILKPLSVFRPAFRAIAQRLTNLDLIFIEEAFERLLLDYDRVFSTQGIPACLWRRTGEIYKGNKEFADLVGVSVEALREGKCAIYELMQEDSAVNYWEKYGAVCFDPGQKAVLTSCVLSTKRARRRAGTNGTAQAPDAADMTASQSQQSVTKEGSDKAGTTQQPVSTSATGLLSCCFSFTIRRDAWGIPYAIVGNFVPIPGGQAQASESAAASLPQPSASTTAAATVQPTAQTKRGQNGAKSPMPPPHARQDVKA